MLIENENKRVEALISYELMDNLPEAELDEITKLTNAICETPISFISLLDHTRSWFMSRQGFECVQLPKGISLCQYTIKQNELLEIQDLLLDKRNVMVSNEIQGPISRFYAGMPLITPSGYKIGTLCVIDYKPRILNENQKFLIKTLSTQIITNFELRKKNKELLKQNEKIQKLSADKEEFFSNMSHELRTPLNAISGFTDLLGKTQLNDKQKEQLGIIRSSIDILISIVNDILDYSKIDSGKLKIEKHAFNFRTLIKTMYELLKIKAQEKNICFSIDITKNIPSYFNGDKLRLNQILVNLVGNAIKFTSRGSVALKIHMIRDAEKEITLNFSVKDTGIGIPTDKIRTFLTGSVK